MRSTTRFTIAAVLALSLSGCVTVGREVGEEQLREFPVGTPGAEITKKLGEPTTVSTDNAGRKTLIYTFMHGQPRPETFIPVVGAFVGGADVRTRNAVLELDEHGRLLRYTVSESKTSAGMGLSGGAYRQPDRTQPQEQLPGGR